MRSSVALATIPTSKSRVGRRLFVPRRAPKFRKNCLFDLREVGVDCACGKGVEHDTCCIKGAARLASEATGRLKCRLLDKRQLTLDL